MLRNCRKLKPSSKVSETVRQVKTVFYHTAVGASDRADVAVGNLLLLGTLILKNKNADKTIYYNANPGWRLDPGFTNPPLSKILFPLLFVTVGSNLESRSCKIF